MVELATGNMATADVNENGQADDCFVGEYDALLTLPMPTHPTAPYGWYGAYVTFPSDAPDYEGPAASGGIGGSTRTPTGISCTSGPSGARGRGSLYQVPGCFVFLVGVKFTSEKGEDNDWLAEKV